MTSSHSLQENGPSVIPAATDITLDLLATAAAPPARAPLVGAKLLPPLQSDITLTSPNISLPTRRDRLAPSLSKHQTSLATTPPTVGPVPWLGAAIALAEAPPQPLEQAWPAVNGGVVYGYRQDFQMQPRAIARPQPYPYPAEGFGFDVALAPSVVAIGAPGSGRPGQGRSGAVYLFDRTGQTAGSRLTAPRPAHQDRFGWAIALTTDTLFVGAPGRDDAATNAGAVYQFSQQGPWQHTYTAAEADPGDGFGFAVAATATQLMVGAPFAEQGADNAGRVHVWDLTQPQPRLTLTAPTTTANSQFGTALALRGNRAVVGAPGASVGTASAVGKVYVFDTLTGQLLQTIVNPSPDRGDEFGQAIALTERHIVVGAQDDDTAAPNAGAVYVFDALTGQLTATLYAPQPQAGDSFGRSLAAAGDRAIAGSRYESRDAARAGAVYRIDLQRGRIQQRLANPSPRPFDLFGHAVDMDTQGSLVSAIGADIPPMLPG